MATIIDGNAIAATIRGELALKVAEMKETLGKIRNTPKISTEF